MVKDERGRHEGGGEPRAHPISTQMLWGAPPGAGRLRYAILRFLGSQNLRFPSHEYK